jgi:hypothetical protein
LSRSGNAALASGALIQAVIGIEFFLAGLSKFVDADYVVQFRGYVQASPGASSGPLAGVIQALVVPNADVMAHVSRLIELGAGAILLLTSLEIARRRLSGARGEQLRYEPLAALLSSGAAFVLGGMSLSIYLLQGGRLPMLNPGFAFASPIAIELFLVPLALAIAFLEFARFIDMRTIAAEQASAYHSE